MRLLYITKSFVAKAGVERVLSDKMNWLAEHGYDIMLVTYEQGNHPDAFTLHPSIKRYDLDARFFKLSSMPILKRLAQYFNYRKRFVVNLQRQVDIFRPDIIITTTYQLKLLDLITKVKSNAKKVIESHMWPLTLRAFPGSREAAIVCFADKYCSAWETLFMRKKGGRPICG